MDMGGIASLSSTTLTNCKRTESVKWSRGYGINEPGVMAVPLTRYVRHFIHCQRSKWSTYFFPAHGMYKDCLKWCSFGKILWCIDPSLDSDHETNNERTVGARYQILISKNRRPLLGNGSIDTFPLQRIRMQEIDVLLTKVSIRECTVCCPRGPRRGVVRKTTGETKSVLRRSLWRKRVSWKRAAIQSEPERESWKISTVRSRYQGASGEDTGGWKRLGLCCGDLL